MPRVGDVQDERSARTELGRGNHGTVWLRVIVGHHTATSPELVGVGVGLLGLLEAPPQPT